MPHVLEEKLHIFHSKGKLQPLKLLGATGFRRKSHMFFLQKENYNFLSCLVPRFRRKDKYFSFKMEATTA